ncbi:hypothetical protein VPH35_050302 [Triticum aestivum]
MPRAHSPRCPGSTHTARSTHPHRRAGLENSPGSFPPRSVEHNRFPQLDLAESFSTSLLPRLPRPPTGRRRAPTPLPFSDHPLVLHLPPTPHPTFYVSRHPPPLSPVPPTAMARSAAGPGTASTTGSGHLSPSARPQLSDPATTGPRRGIQPSALGAATSPPSSLGQL